MTDVLAALGAEDDTSSTEEESLKKDLVQIQKKCEALIIITSLITSSLRY